MLICGRVFADCKCLSAVNRKVMSQTFASWNRMIGWLRQLEAIRVAA